MLTRRPEITVVSEFNLQIVLHHRSGGGRSMMNHELRAAPGLQGARSRFRAAIFSGGRGGDFP